MTYRELKPTKQELRQGFIRARGGIMPAVYVPPPKPPAPVHNGGIGVPSRAPRAAVVPKNVE